MKYRIAVADAAKAQLRALPKEIRRNIGHRINLLAEDLAGDVKKLHAKHALYRLRVGEYRVLFQIADGAIEIYAVKRRKDAYA